MINTIKYIPHKLQIDKLKKYVRNKEIEERLAHIGIPFLENEETEELSNNDTFICESDLVIFSTSNNIEESYLQFHIYDKKHEDFVIHHDIFVYSPINDSEYFCKNNEHFIALATCETDIMIYDTTVFNPMTPQILLKGHDDGVLSFFFDKSFYSGGDDKKIIEWDLETASIKCKYNTNLKVEKLTKCNEILLYAEKNKIESLTTGDNFLVTGNIENMISNDNFIYITTSTGDFHCYDSRNMKNMFFTHKYSKDALTGIDLLKEKIGLCSKSGEVWCLDSKDFEIKNSEKINTSLFSLKLHEDNIIFYGDESDTLQIKKMRNDIF